MKRINTILLVAVAALFALSVVSYRASIERGERFERGQRFLPNLNPDEIAEIHVTEGGETVHLERGQDRFVVASAEGYPARNESVNRLVRDLSELALEKEVGTGEGLVEKLGLTEGAEGAIDVRFVDATGNDMVHVRIGQTLDDEGGGSYVQRVDREDAPIYLTGSRVYLQTAEADFLQDEILNLEQDRITAIRSEDWALVRGESGQLELEDAPEGTELDGAKLNQAKSMLSFLRFEKHHLADAPEVATLAFGPPVRVTLDDRSGYLVRVAEDGEKHYLVLEGFLDVDRIEVAEDDTEEQNEANADLLKRADEIQEFNQLHGSWVYEVSKTTADKVRITRADLLGEG